MVPSCSHLASSVCMQPHCQSANCNVDAAEKLDQQSPLHPFPPPCILLQLPSSLPSSPCVFPASCIFSSSLGAFRPQLLLIAAISNATAATPAAAKQVLGSFALCHILASRLLSPGAADLTAPLGPLRLFEITEPGNAEFSLSPSVDKPNSLVNNE